MMRSKEIILIYTLLLINGGYSHVSLTFPPARAYPLDFLNSFWTKQPCGMPRGNIKTSLLAGQAFNATWHLGYAHQGGYRIELLDSNEQRILDLTPTRDNDFYQGRSTAQWHYVEIPENATCRRCTIRLLRQVPEFAPNFQFISCADVDIVSRHDYVETCSGHGYANSGRCTCYAKFWGDKCQYKDECDTDGDCNGLGTCTFIGGSALPRKQCYCPENSFGVSCNRRNPGGMPTRNNLDLKRHVRIKVDERMAIYFKILLGPIQSQDEIEFVMRINGTSYGGLGWRPSGLGAICKSWPFYPDALSLNNNHRISKRSSTFTITKSIDHTDTFGGQGQSNVNRSPSPVPVETFSYGQKRVLTQNNVQIISSQPPQRQNVQVVERLEARPPPPQPQRPKVTTTVLKERPQTQVQSPPSPQSPNFTPSEWAAQDPFTPMDCSDIVFGSAIGSHHRLRDAYSRGRHTPLVDAQWGGRDDLLGATGWEDNGITTLAFRRRMDSLESSPGDHSIRGEMLLIWARGQEPGEFIRSSSHQLESGVSRVSSFYTRDELKYHGLGSQRGLLYVDFNAVRKEYQSGAYST